MNLDLTKLVEKILNANQARASGQSLLIGLSGIDASGKGFVTKMLEEKLGSAGFRVANINVDGWLNLPDVRFNCLNPRLHFYKNALRLDEMFARLIIPLKQQRSINITADFAEETANTFRKHQYIYEDIDIILLEGIFLFKRQYIRHFDLKVWIECTFDAALKRAIARAQEGLSTDETINAYKTIYFPAQKIHFENDLPRESADIILHNN